MSKLPATLKRLWLSAAFLLWLPGASLAAESSEQINLQLHWKHQFEFAGYYAALHKGYYAEAGLNVAIRELSSTGSAIEEVLTGSAQYGTSPSGLILERMKGAPLILLANDLKTSPLVLLTSTKYTDLKQLKGRKVMGARFEPQHAEIVYMLKANGIEIDELDWVQHSFDTDDIINGKAAAMTAYLSNQPFHLFSRNIPYTIFAPSKYGFNFYGNCLFTSKQERADNPQRAQKFRDASVRGWEYAVAHPDEIIAHILASYPVEKTEEALRFEATEISKLVTAGDCPVGAIDPTRIDNIAKMFVAIGMAEPGYDLSGFIADEAQLCRSNEESAMIKSPELQLTPEEQAYLSQRSDFKVCMIKDWPPYEMFDEQGQASGLCVDLSQIFGKLINKELTPLATESMPDLLETIRQRDCDMVMLLDQGPGREDYLTFTEPVFKTPFVIIGRSGQGYHSGIETLSGKTMALFKGHKEIDNIRNNHPSIKLLLTESLQDAFRKVQSGEADITLCALASFVSSVSMMGLTELEVIGETGLHQSFSIAVRNDEPQLAAIMKKALATLNPKELQETTNRWFNARVEKRFDYTLFGQILAAVLIAVLLLLYRHILLSRHHLELHKAHRGMQQEKERAEKALKAERDAIQGNLRFVDMISHEYRTPVSVIKTNIDIIRVKSSKPDYEIKSNLEKMGQATIKLTEIIEIALDKERLDEDKLIPRKQSFSFSEIIFTTSREIQQSQLQRLTLETSQLPPKFAFYGDKGLLKIMLRNLLENAFKYSPAHEKVSLSAQLGDNAIILKIRDHGRGIPQEEQAGIFEKYRRASNAGDVPGAGIGLHMVKTIVEQHHGRITLTSPAEGGALITISLPIE